MCLWSDARSVVSRRAQGKPKPLNSVEEACYGLFIQETRLCTPVSPLPLWTVGNGESALEIGARTACSVLNSGGRLGTSRPIYSLLALGATYDGQLYSYGAVRSAIWCADIPHDSGGLAFALPPCPSGPQGHLHRRAASLNYGCSFGCNRRSCVWPGLVRLGRLAASPVGVWSNDRRLPLMWSGHVAAGWEIRALPEMQILRNQAGRVVVRIAGAEARARRARIIRLMRCLEV